MSPKCFRETRDLLRSCISADTAKPENAEEDQSSCFAKAEIVLMLLKLLPSANYKKEKEQKLP